MVEDTCGRYPPFNFNPQKASRNGLKGSQELDAQWPFLTMDTVYNTHSRHGPTYYWEVPISPDGPPAPQYGTIQEVWANMAANYPGWNDRRPVRDFSNTSKARNMTADAGTDFRVVMMGLYTRDSSLLRQAVELLLEVGHRGRPQPSLLGSRQGQGRARPGRVRQGQLLLQQRHLVVQ